MDLGDALRAQGRSQRWIAEQLGLSRSALNRKLHGSRRFTVDELTRLAALVDLPPVTHIEARTRQEVA